MSYMVPAIGLRCRVAKMSYWCFLEGRPAVQGIFLLRFLAGASLAGPLPIKDLRLWVGGALWVFVSLSVYILNGVMDVEEDRINKSSRPVASGKLTVRQAAGTACALAVVGVTGSLALGGLIAASALAALVLGWLYSGPPFYLKRWPLGWAAIAILAALITYNAGYMINGGGRDRTPLLLFAVMMALWMGLVGQTKDLSDIEGDKEAGRRSVPVVWGEDTARVVYSGVALCIGGGYVLSAVVFATSSLVPAIALVFGAVAVTVITLGPWSKGDRSRRRRSYKAFMLTQYGVNLAVVLS